MWIDPIIPVCDNEIIYGRKVERIPPVYLIFVSEKMLCAKQRKFIFVKDHNEANHTAVFNYVE